MNKADENTRLRCHLILTCIMLLMISIILSNEVINAYFIASDTAVNTFTVGYESSEIQEEYYPPEEIREGSSFTKNVTVKNTGTVDVYVRIFAEMADSRMEDSLTVDWNTEDWEKADDGYWYYKKVLKSGDSTSPIFTTITAKEDIEAFEMIIYEESIQKEGFTSAKDAFGFI